MTARMDAAINRALLISARTEDEKTSNQANGRNKHRKLKSPHPIFGLSWRKDQQISDRPEPEAAASAAWYGPLQKAQNAERGDDAKQHREKHFGFDIPMGELRKTDVNELGEKNSVLHMLPKELCERQMVLVPFPEKRNHRPFVPEWHIHSVGGD
jgi:hypothetical protein